MHQARSRSGSALVLALVTVAVIAVLGVGLVQIQASLDARQSHAADRRAALYVAEAGVAEASLAVSQGRSGAIASEDVPARFGSGVYWVDAENLPGGRKLLTAHGLAGTARFSVQAMVLPNVSPIGEYGFFGDEFVRIGYGAMLDGYDSRDGSYVAQVDPTLPFTSTGEGVEVYSNGDIIVADTPSTPPPADPTEGAGAEGKTEEPAAGVSTPLWDTLTSGVADPAWDPNSYMVVASVAPNFIGASLTNDSTMEEHLQFLVDLQSGAMNQREAERLLGRSDFRVLPDVIPDVDLATGTVSSTEVAEFEEIPISMGEYVYLMMRKLYGASLEDIEQGFATMSRGGMLEPTPEPSTTEPLPEPTLAGSIDGTYIFGEAVPGPDSYVATSGTASITETSAPQEEDLEMPPVVLPGGLRAAPSPVALASGDVRVLTGEDVWFDSVLVSAGATLVLQGPLTLATGTLDVAGGGALEIDDSAGPVRVYATDRLNFAGGSLLTSTTPHEEALGTHVFVGGREGSAAGSRVRIAASGEFHGVLYAPEDQLLIPNTLRYFGAAAANQLLFQDWAVASYDRAFAEGGTGAPSLPKILSWQVVPIEEGRIRSLRFDPIQSLRMQGIEPVASSNAAVETDFEVQYLDGSGNVQTYSGRADAFDWSSVSRVTQLRWLSPATGLPLNWTVPSGYDPDLLVTQFRADERMRIYGTEVPPHPAGTDALLAEADAIDLGSLELAPMPTADTTLSSVESAPIITGAESAPLSASAAETTTAEAPPVEDPLAGVAASPIEMSDVESLVTSIEMIGGDAKDLNGDGVSSTLQYELDGSTLKLVGLEGASVDVLEDAAAYAELREFALDSSSGTYTKTLSGMEKFSVELILGSTTTTTSSDLSGSVGGLDL